MNATTWHLKNRSHGTYLHFKLIILRRYYECLHYSASILRPQAMLLAQCGSTRLPGGQGLWELAVSKAASKARTPYHLPQVQPGQPHFNSPHQLPGLCLSESTKDLATTKYSRIQACNKGPKCSSIAMYRVNEFRLKRINNQLNRIKKYESLGEWHRHLREKRKNIMWM